MTERALSSIGVADTSLVPRVLFKELFVPGIFRVPLVPPPLSVCSGSQGMPEVPPVSGVSIPAVPHSQRGSFPRVKCDLC